MNALNDHPNPTARLIDRLRKAIDDTRRERYAALVEHELAQEIREEPVEVTGDDGKTYTRARGWMEASEIALQRIGEMNDEKLEAEYERLHDSYYETADSDQLEADCETDGYISGLERAIELHEELDKVENAALDKINLILSDPEWGVGMLEDICAIVLATGRKEVEGATWDRH